MPTLFLRFSYVMNSDSLYHLVILFEESKPKLSDTISYACMFLYECSKYLSKAPSLPYPFEFRKPKGKTVEHQSLESLGNRNFYEIIVENLLN